MNFTIFAFIAIIFLPAILLVLEKIKLMIAGAAIIAFLFYLFAATPEQQAKMDELARDIFSTKTYTPLLQKISENKLIKEYLIQNKLRDLPEKLVEPGTFFDPKRNFKETDDIVEIVKESKDGTKHKKANNNR